MTGSAVTARRDRNVATTQLNPRSRKQYKDASILTIFTNILNLATHLMGIINVTRE